MTLSRMDAFITSVNDGTRYKDVSYPLYKSDGTRIYVKGPWILCDGGYLRWRCMQCPMAHPDGIDVLRFSKMLESMRQDVECVFGILKGRFRILKYGFRVHDAKKIDDIVFTASILHNMLLRFDGINEWEDGVNYEGEDGRFGSDIMSHVLPTDPQHYHLEGDYSLSGRFVRTRTNINCSVPQPTAMKSDTSANTALFSQLVINFAVKRERNMINWPRRTTP